jgi:bla regulator protein BlaR1
MMNIQNFDDCVGAGNAVSQTYPLQCIANGEVFIKEGSDPVEVAVKNVVVSFGAVMSLVSTSAPKKIAAQAIKDNYAHLVSPTLLANWMNNPAKAPGRKISSPWPDHIAITSIMHISTTTYAMTGNVIEITSDNVAHGGIADQYAVTTTVAIVSGNWVITKWESTR